MSSLKMKLSERIVKSGHHILERVKKMPYFTKHFVSQTVDEEAKQFAKFVVKDALDFFKFYAQILKMGIEKTDSVEEKQVFENMIAGADQMLNNYKEKAERVLGKFDDKYLSQPMSQTLYSYKQNLLAVTSTGTFLHFLVVNLAFFNVYIWDTKCLNNNPNIKSSPFVGLFTTDGDTQWEKIFHLICSMIDKRDDISETEESKLKEIYKRALTYEFSFKEYVFTGKEWSGGLLYQ